jgi:CBS domain-containing protein
MTPIVISVGSDQTIVDATELMLRYHISGLPVIDAAGELIGILSESDLMRRAEPETQRQRQRRLSFLVGADKSASGLARPDDRRVGEIMTPDPLTVSEDTPLDQIAEIMENNAIKRLPVVRGKQLVGMVTRADFVAAIADLALELAWPSNSDTAIGREVTNVLTSSGWRPSRLQVTVRDGVVSLRGVANSAPSRRAAIVAAETVPGVRKVIDRLSTAAATPPLEQALGSGHLVCLSAAASTDHDEPR